MTSCDICQEKCKEERCPVCSIMLPILTKGQSTLLPSEAEMNGAAEYLGLERGHRGEFWSRIDTKHGTDINWMFDPQDVDESRWIVGPPPAWELDDEMKEIVESGRRHPEGRIARRRLQRGGILPDGTYLSWADGQFWMDGIPVNIPYLTIEKLLQRSDVDSYNWRALILTMNFACNVVPMGRGPRLRYNEPDGRFSSEVCLHPVLNLVDVRPAHFDNDIRVRLSFMHRHTQYLRSWIDPQSLQNVEWFRRWLAFSEMDYLNLEEPYICKNFVIKNGRLLLRMRKGTQWKTRRLPADPFLIARILSWALSPTNHPEHMRLRCLQYGLLTPEMFQLDEPNLKGIEFLRGIVNHEKVEIDRENMRFLVDGTSGIRWSVTPGDGPHGSRFRVKPFSIGKDSIERLPRSFRNHVCIVETDNLRRLVLGDALGGIVLALLDDVNSSQRIETLVPVLRDAEALMERQQTSQQRAMQRLAERIARERRHELAEQENENELEEIRRLQQEEEARRLEARNEAEEIAIRATVAFPRLWSVILRCQIGTRVRITMRGDGNRIIIFSQWDTTMTIRNRIEEELVNQMLDASGWRRSVEHENPEFDERVFVRATRGQHEMARVVERFGEILEPMITIRNRMRITPGPAWANFERRNPGPGQLLPFTDGPLD